MPRMDPALKKRFMEYVDRLLENYRKADGTLDEAEVSGAALALWGKEAPDERAWWDTLSPQHSAEIVCGEFARRRRAAMRRRMAEEDAADAASGFEPRDDRDPSPEELNTEYQFPVGGGQFIRKKAGDASPIELFALAEYHGGMKHSHATTENYHYALARRSQRRQMALGLDDTATLFSIFGA